MSFYKQENETDTILLEGPNFVYGPDYTLLKEQKDTYQYPVSGWYWFDTELEAYTFFNLPVPNQGE